MKPSHANDNLTERTCRLWKRRLGRDLSSEDARQIVENATGFFAILAEWSRAEVPVPANENIVQLKPARNQKEKQPEQIVEQGGKGGSQP